MWEEEPKFLVLSGTKLVDNKNSNYRHLFALFICYSNFDMVGHLVEIPIAPIFDKKEDSQLYFDQRRPNPECDRDDLIYSLRETAVEPKNFWFDKMSCLSTTPIAGTCFASQVSFETV